MKAQSINNEIYHSLGTRWYEASDDPIALLRAESKVKNPWVRKTIEEQIHGDPGNVSILDIGCGAGFLSNDLSRHGYRVTGVDLSESSLDVAHAYDPTQRTTYVKADANELPFPTEHFDVVTCMDFLEHVDDPNQVIAQAARVLKPGGLFIFHTFNRSWLSNLIIIKGMEWFVKNTPPHLHVIELFVKPEELAAYCRNNGMHVEKTLGIAPVINGAFFKMLLTREVPENFRFHFTKKPKLGYVGFAKKEIRFKLN